MSAPTYVIARCAVCQQQFNVDKKSDGFNRVPYVCDGDFRGDAQPAFDVRQGAMSEVSRVPEENRVATLGRITRAPLPTQPTAQAAAEQLVPSYDQPLERVDPEEAARQRAMAPAEPGTIAEHSEADQQGAQANVLLGNGASNTRGAGVSGSPEAGSNAAAH